jgi:hypothetical protein
MTIYITKWNIGKEAEMGRTGKPMKKIRKMVDLMGIEPTTS